MSEAAPKRFLDRTLAQLRDAWQSIAGAAYDAAAASMRPDLPEDDIDGLRSQMRACLETRGGEVSARARRRCRSADRPPPYPSPYHSPYCTLDAPPPLLRALLQGRRDEVFPWQPSVNVQVFSLSLSTPTSPSNSTQLPPPSN